MIQRARTHINQNFVCLDLWISNVRDFENFRPTVLFEDNGRHDRGGGQRARGKGIRTHREQSVDYPAKSSCPAFCTYLFGLRSCRSYRADSMPCLTSSIAALIKSSALPRWPPLSALA